MFKSYVTDKALLSNGYLKANDDDVITFFYVIVNWLDKKHAQQDCDFNEFQIYNL